MSIFGCKENEYYFSVETFKNTAVEINEKTFFILNQDDSYLSVIFNHKIEQGRGGYSYSCYWKQNNKETWSKENTQKSHGVIYENYSHIENDQGIYTIIEDNGKLFIKCNGFNIEWSADKWVYLQTINGRVKIAITSEKSIENIDYYDKNLEWK